MENIIVIGGGPSGIMASISAKTHHPQANVILLERNERIGKKLGFTGGGRCNVTANVDVDKVIENVCKNGKFMYSSLSQFGPSNIIAYFNNRGCKLVEEDHYRMFPYDGKSQTIIQTLYEHLIELKVNLKLNTVVESIDFEEKVIVTNQGVINYDHLIIASGGKVLPGSGSDGSGYKWAHQLGHTITDLLPAEVPLVSNDTVIQDKTLQGLSFKDITLKLFKKNKLYKALTHDLLITHFGLSGPVALRMSFYVQKVLEKEKTAQLKIDFIPDLAFEDIDYDSVSEYLPKRLIEYIKSISPNLQIFKENVKGFPLSVYETRGFAHAFVTNGGISVKEIDPKTMKSKLNDSVSFCGEVLDYNAFTGGFNITCALSGGYTAGKHSI